MADQTHGEWNGLRAKERPQRKRVTCAACHSIAVDISPEGPPLAVCFPGTEPLEPMSASTPSAHAPPTPDRGLRTRFAGITLGIANESASRTRRIFLKGLLARF